MKFLLKSPYPCLIKTQTNECELENNDTLEIEDERRIFVYPQNKKMLPFYIDLFSQKDCENYSFITRGEKRFVILDNPSKFKLITKEKLNFSGKNVEICVDDDILSFETEDKKIECVRESQSPHYSCFKIKNFACVQFEKELFLFSVKQGKIFHFVGDIEISGNQISVTKHYFDSEKREKKSIFRIEDEIELENEEYICTQNIKNSNINTLSPYKLMESIKAKDYAHALNFLSEKLKNKIDVAQIKDFFGNFKFFLPISTTEFITVDEKKKNYVQFSLTGNMIDDISVDGL